MKNKILTLIAVLCLSLLSNPAKANNPKRSSDSLCLEISGRLLKVKAVEDREYKVELVYNGEIVDSLTLKDKNEFKFNLKKNTVYGIRITKKGYVSRIISIDTSLPQFAKAFFRFQFDTELIETAFSKNLDQDALDFPIALISFNQQMGCFYYSEEYTSNIKRQLYLGEKFLK
ncbi:MAG: hypothetical protein K0S32_68 [Bacteroidetes bacterium]|jgi:hypothetical protein|nr:hypothetical protein [Bacteroidota bacterium]